MRGYEYWKNTFFLSDGTPKYYDYKVLPLDIQCCSQAIDALVFFSDRDPEALPLALKVAHWTSRNMQDEAGYFYYRRYCSWPVSKTPTLPGGKRLCYARSRDSINGFAAMRVPCEEKNPHHCSK
jgi:hypothetical protein